MDVAEDPVELAVDRFQRGLDREESFRRIVEGTYQPIKGFFARRVFSPADCLELTQETFLGIYQGLDGFRRQARFRTWAYKIAHTTYLKWLQRRKVRSDVDGDALGSPDDGAAWDDEQLVATSSVTPLDDLLRQETRDRLDAAVRELPPQERQCVILRVYQDLSHQEIAEFLGIAVGTVKAHLHHARQKLRTRLEASFGGIDF